MSRPEGGRLSTDERVEVDWRFEPADAGEVERRLPEVAREAGLEIEAGAPRQIDDVYLDTHDWRLYRAGLAFCLRHVTGERSLVASLEPLGNGHDGPESRREIVQTIGAESPGDMAAIRSPHAPLPPGPVGDRVRALTGASPLETLLEIHTERRIWLLGVSGRVAAELSIDDSRVGRPAGGEAAHLSRVEVELGRRTAGTAHTTPDDKGEPGSGGPGRTTGPETTDTGGSPAAASSASGARAESTGAPPRSNGRTNGKAAHDAAAIARIVPFVEKMRASCALREAPDSRLEAGLRIRGVVPAAWPDLGSVDIDASSSIAEVAFAALRRHFDRYRRNETGTRLGEDPEALHDMRVSSRRLRAAQGLFEDYLPSSCGAIRRGMKRIGRVLGAVRDCDVQLGHIREWEKEAGVTETHAFDALTSLLLRRRERARARMLSVLDSSQYERFVGRCTGTLRKGPPARSPASKIPAVAAAPDLIARRYRKVRKAGDPLASLRSAAALDAPEVPQGLHALRIHCKRLRYALEFHSPIYGKPADSMIETLVRLQDLLGEHQDLQVTRRHIDELVRGRGRRLPPEAIFALGIVSQRAAKRAARLRRRFAKTYRGLRGDRWKTLRRQMEKQVLSGAAPSRAAARGATMIRRKAADERAGTPGATRIEAPRSDPGSPPARPDRSRTPDPPRSTPPSRE